MKSGGRELTNFLALRNRQKISARKSKESNPVLLAIGRILETVAENTGWLSLPSVLTSSSLSSSSRPIVGV